MLLVTALGFELGTELSDEASPPTIEGAELTDGDSLGISLGTELDESSVLPEGHAL